MSGTSESGLGRPILIALGAYLVSAALVMVVAWSIDRLTSAPFSVTAGVQAKECTITETLGAAVKLTCEDERHQGVLQGVEGDPERIGAAIAGFSEFHAKPLTCTLYGEAIECAAGSASLNEHLARHGFAPPSNESTRVQREAWFATLLGFAGAIIALQLDRLRERSASERREEEAREKRRIEMKVLKAVTGSVKKDLQNAVTSTAQGAPDSGEKMRHAIAQARSYVLQLAESPLPRHLASSLGIVLDEVERVQPATQASVSTKIKECFNAISEALREFPE